jgi:hypothetical protein
LCPAAGRASGNAEGGTNWEIIRVDAGVGVLDSLDAGAIDLGEVPKTVPRFHHVGHGTVGACAIRVVLIHSNTFLLKIVHVAAASSYVAWFVPVTLFFIVTFWKKPHTVIAVK